MKTTFSNWKLFENLIYGAKIKIPSIKNPQKSFVSSSTHLKNWSQPSLFLAISWGFSFFGNHICIKKEDYLSCFLCDYIKQLSIYLDSRVYGISSFTFIKTKARRYYWSLMDVSVTVITLADVWTLSTAVIGGSLSLTLSTISLTPVRDIKITSRALLKRPFRGHWIITPCLDLDALNLTTKCSIQFNLKKLFFVVG